MKYSFNESEASKSSEFFEALIGDAQVVAEVKRGSEVKDRIKTRMILELSLHFENDYK